MGTYQVGGVVLAAGRSVRMERPKPLLAAGDRSFLAACVVALREGGCDPVVVVVGGPAGEAAAREARAVSATVVWSRAAGAEQIDSLRIGIEALASQAPGTAAAAVLPVDHPLVSPTTVRSLVSVSSRAPDAIIRPTVSGQPGHPTLFPRSTWSALESGELPAGARSVVESPATSVRDVEVGDPGVVDDLDTPEDYRAALGRDP